MGRMTVGFARRIAELTRHLGWGGRLRRRAAAAAGGRAAGLTLSAVRVFARLFSPKLFAVAFVLGGALSAQSAFAFGAVSSVGRFLRGRMRGVGASGFPLSAVRGFLQLFSPKLFAVAFVLCGALSAQSAFAFGAIAAGGSGSNPSHGVAINQATRAGADAEALRLCEAGGADCHLIRRFINLCGIVVADSDATTDLAGIPSGTLATGSQAQAAGFYSRTYPSTSNANTARTQAIIQCTNFGGTSCAAIAGANGCDTTTIPSCPAGQGVDIVESSVCGVCPLARPIVHTTGPGGTAGVCRGAFNQGECTALDATYHYVNSTGACRVRQAGDCVNPTAIYVSASNTCRAPATDEECKAKDPTLEKVGNRCLDICTSGTQVRDTFGGCRAVQNASDCTGTATPIFVSASTTCRAATNQAECTALTGGSALMFDGGACRDRVASDCAAPNGFFVSASKTCRPATQADCDATTATPILQNGACRAATNQGECSALTGGSALVFVSGGACRDRVAGDCAGTTPIFVSASKTCREALQADCTGNTPILDNGACRTRQMNDCPNHAPVLDGGTCRPRQLGDTFGAYYEYEKQDVVSGTTLRFINGGFVVNQASPEEAARLALEACQSRFDIAPGSTTIHQCEETVVGGFNDMCIDVATVGSLTGYFGIGATPAAAAADRVAKLPAGTSFGTARAACDCGGTTPIPDGNTCKAAATQAECTAVHAGLVFVSGGTCRPRTASECRDNTPNTPILGNDGVCRARIQADCDATPATPILDSTTNQCRERIQADCTAIPATPILDSTTNQCREREARDCTGTTPILQNNACRAAADQDECTAKEATLIFDSGSCRERHSGDNFGAYYSFTGAGFANANNGDHSFNQPTQAAANAEAFRLCEERRNRDFGGTGTTCDAHPDVPNGFTQCINTGERGATRFVGLGADPDAARLAREAKSGTQFINNVRAVCNCGDGQSPQGNGCQPTTAANCAGVTPIFDGTNCRVRMASDCTGLTPIFVNADRTCRERRQSDCRGTNSVLDATTKQCRPPQTSAECPSATPVYDSGRDECRLREASDCVGTTTPIFVSANRTCRERVASDCSGATPELFGGNCLQACAVLTPALPVRDATTGNCRAREARDCGGTTPELFKGRCEAACPAGAPVRDLTSENCRLRQASDCVGDTPIFEDNICRERQLKDCADTTPILENGNCRTAANQFECTNKDPTLQFVNNGTCRTRIPADCTNPTKPVLDADTLLCRERERSDCTEPTPDFFGGNCLAACPDIQPVRDRATGNCRSLDETDCFGDTPVFRDNMCHQRLGEFGAVALGTVDIDISPVNRGALTNPAHPAYSAANGMIQVFGIAQLQGSAGSARRNALAACSRAMSNHPNAMTLATGRDCRIVAEYANAVAAVARLASAPYGDHYFVASVTLAAITMTMQTAIDAAIARAETAARTAAKSACDTFAIARSPGGAAANGGTLALVCERAPSAVVRNVAAAQQVCGSGATLDSSGTSSACVCLPGYTNLDTSGAVPVCSLDNTVPLCDTSKGAFLNAERTACECAAGWGDLDSSASPQVCGTPRCDGPSAFYNTNSGLCECSEGYDRLGNSVGADGTSYFTCTPTALPTCRADRGSFYNALEARCDCRAGFENLQPDGAAANTYVCSRSTTRTRCDAARGAVTNPDYGAAGEQPCECTRGFRNLTSAVSGGETTYYCAPDFTPPPTCEASDNQRLNRLRTACECVPGTYEQGTPPACVPVEDMCDAAKGAYPNSAGTGCACAPGYHNLDDSQLPNTCTPRIDSDSVILNAQTGEFECKEGFSNPRLERTVTGILGTFGGGLLQRYDAAELDLANLSFVCAPNPTPDAPMPNCDNSRNAFYSAKYNTCVCRIGPSGAGRPEFGLDRKQDPDGTYYCETSNYLSGAEGRQCDPSRGSHTNPLVYANIRQPDPNNPALTVPVDIAPCVCDIGYLINNFREGPERGAGTKGIACTIDTNPVRPQPRAVLPVCSLDKGTRYNADNNDCECLPGYQPDSGSDSCSPMLITDSVADCDIASAQLDDATPPRCECRSGYFNLRDRPAAVTLTNGHVVYSPQYFCTSAQNVQARLSPNPGFSGSECSAAGYQASVNPVLTMTLNAGQPNERTIVRYRQECSVRWGEISADNIPLLSNDANPTAPSPIINQADSCVIQQFEEHSPGEFRNIPLERTDTLRYCSDLFGGPARAGSFPNIIAYADARAADFNDIAPGTTLVARYRVGQRLYVVIGDGVYTANGVQISSTPFVINTEEGFDGADCGQAGVWEPDLQVTQPQGGASVVRLRCLIKWRESATPPALRVTASPPVPTAQGESCILGQHPANQPLARGVRHCASLFVAACPDPTDDIGCFTQIYSRIHQRIWQYNPILKAPTPDFPIVSPTNPPVLYVTPDGRVYNANGIEAAAPLVFSATTPGFEPADCTRGGWETEGELTLVARERTVRQYCNVRWRDVPTAPPLGAVAAPPAATAQDERCMIRQSPPPAANAPDTPRTCGDLLALAGANFGGIGDLIDERTSRINGGRSVNIPLLRRGANLDGNDPLYRIPDGRVFSQYGVGTDVTRFSAPAAGWGEDECRAAGFRVEVRVTLNDLQMRTCGTKWARAASPPAASATRVSLADFSATSSGNDCVIQHSPDDRTLPAGTESCEALLSGGAADFDDFAEVLAHMEARRGEVNPLLPGDDIPAFNPREGRFVVTPDDKVFSDNGIEATETPIAMGTADTGYDMAGCVGAGWTAMTMSGVWQTTPVIRHVCSVAWRESATPPPVGGTPPPAITKEGGYCVIAETTRGEDLLRCSDLLGRRASGGVANFGDVLSLLPVRRGELNALSPTRTLAGDYEIGTNTLYVGTGENSGLFTDQGIEIGSAVYSVAGATGGFNAAACDLAGEAVEITLDYSQGAGTARRIRQYCSVEWAEVATPPPLATMAVIPRLEASGRGCLIASNPSNIPILDDLKRCDVLFAGETSFISLTANIVNARAEVNGRVDNPIPPPLGSQLLSQTLYVHVGGDSTTGRVWDANGVGRGLTPFELPGTEAEGAGAGFTASDCTGGWTTTGRLSPSDDGTVMHLCNVRWRRADAPPPILTEADVPDATSDSNVISDSDVCVIAQRPTTTTLPAGYERCDSVLSGLGPLPDILANMDARRVSMNAVPAALNFPTPVSTPEIPAFDPAASTLYVVGSPPNVRAYSPNGVEATGDAFAFAAAEDANFIASECATALGASGVSAQSTVVGVNQQVRILCNMKWRRIAEVPAVSRNTLNVAATASGDACVIRQWPTNAVLPADSGLEYCGDVLGDSGSGAVVDDFSQLHTELVARIADYNTALTPSGGDNIFPLQDYATDPIYIAANRGFSKHGVEITDTAFNFNDDTAGTGFTHHNCANSGQGLTLAFEGDVDAGVQRIRQVCSVKWARVASPPPPREPPIAPTPSTARGDWCVIQQHPAPANWTPPANRARCETILADGGTFQNALRNHDFRATDLNSRWGAGIQLAPQANNTLYIVGDTYYYSNGIGPEATWTPPTPTGDTRYYNTGYEASDCQNVYGTPGYEGSVGTGANSTIQIFTRTCDIPWRRVPTAPPFATTADSSALDAAATAMGENCVLAQHPLPPDVLLPPDQIRCDELMPGAAAIVDIRGRFNSRISQVNTLIAPQFVPPFDPTRPLYITPDNKIYSENGLELSGDAFTPNYSGGSSVADDKFNAAACMDNGFSVGTRLVAGGFAEVCEIKWRKSATPPNILANVSNLPQATESGDWCVTRHTTPRGPALTLPTESPWCDDLLNGVDPSTSEGEFKLMNDLFPGRRNALNAAGANLPEFNKAADAIYIVGGNKIFTQNGVEMLRDPAVGLTEKSLTFNDGECIRTEAGHNLILRAEVSGDSHILRQYCDVRWRQAATAPPLAVPANPPRTFTKQGDDCLLAQGPANAPVPDTAEWCSDLFGEVNTFAEIYTNLGDWRELMNKIPPVANRLPIARVGGPNVSANNYEIFYLTPPTAPNTNQNIYTENGIPVRASRLTFVQTVVNNSNFSITDCTSNSRNILTLAFNGGAANDLLVGRYCDVSWRVADSAPPLDKDATSANLPAPTSQGERCLIDQNPAAQTTPASERWCRDLFANTNVGNDSLRDIYAHLQARQGEINILLDGTTNDFPAIAAGARPLWVVGAAPIPRTFHGTGIEANNAALTPPGSTTGAFSMADCDGTFGDGTPTGGKARIRVSSNPADGRVVVQRVCEVEWRRVEDAPGLSRAKNAGPFTEQGSECIIAQNPAPGTDPGNVPLPPGQYMCSALFGGGGATFSELDTNRQNRAAEVNAEITEGGLPSYPASDNADNPYILSGNSVYDIYGVPIRAAAFVANYNDGPIEGADWHDHERCENAFTSRLPGADPSVDIVAGGLAEICKIKWRRVDSAPPLSPDAVLNPGQFPAPSAAASRKEGDACVVRATFLHNSSDANNMPNNLDYCSTLLNAGGKFTGFSNIFSNATSAPYDSLRPVFPGVQVPFVETGSVPTFIFGNRIFTHRGIEWGKAYTQQGATTNWPGSTTTTPTTICGKDPADPTQNINAVGRTDGQNAIQACPTQWRRLSEAPNLQTFPYSPRDGNAGTQTAAGDYCILSQSETPTDAQTAQRCDMVFGDVAGGIQRIIDDAVQSHGFINPALSSPYPVDLTNTGIYWVHGTDIYSPYGVKLQGGTNVDYVLSAEQGGFTAGDCANASYIRQGFVSGRGAYQTCSIRVGYATTPPPLGETANPPASTGNLPNCDIRKTANVPARPARSCSAIFANYGSSFTDIVNKAEAMRTEINSLSESSIPALSRGAGTASARFYIVREGAASDMYTSHGVPLTRSTYEPQVPGFTAADCRAAGWAVKLESGYVQCEMDYRYVNSPPPLSDNPSPPSSTNGRVDCNITITRGLPLQEHTRCHNVLSGTSGFQDVVANFNARRTEYNVVFSANPIPAFALNSTVYVVTTGANAGVYTQHGIQATDTGLLEPATGGFTIEDCTASGHRLNVNRNPNTGDVSVNCQMIVWTVDTKPPLANPATPPARPGNTNQESGCRITQSPGAPAIVVGETCSQLLGAHVSSFSQMTDRFTARRGEYNGFNAPNNIPNYVPWDGSSSNQDSILYRVVSGADAGIYTRYGLQAHNTDSVAPVLFDPNIDTADCTAANRTATSRTVGGVQIAECSGRFNMGADRPPYLAFNPGANSRPVGGTTYEKCAYAALPQNGALPSDTIKCNDFLSPATSGIADFSELLTRYGERRNDLFHPTANTGILKPHNTGSGFDRYRATQITYLHGGKLYFHNGIELRDTPYTLTSDRNDQAGFTSADCTAAGYTLSTTTAAFNGINWPNAFCAVKHVNLVLGIGLQRVNIQNTKHNPPTSALPNTPPNIPPVQPGCNIGIPATNAGFNGSWNNIRCDRLFGGGGTSFTRVLGQFRAITPPTNSVEGTTIPATGPNAHGPADPIFVIWNASNVAFELQSIYGVRLHGIRSAPLPDEDNSELTKPLERFSRQDCVNAGWTSGGTGTPGAGDLQEFCNILWRRRTTTAPTPPTTPPEEQSAAVSESSLGGFGFQDGFDPGGGATYPKLLAAPAFTSSSPLAEEDEIAPQTHEGEEHKHCITRHAKAAATPPPSDMQCGNVFARHGGFPELAMIKKAASDNGVEFDPTSDALSVDESGKVLLVKADENGKMIEVPIPKPLGASSATPAASGGGGGGGGGAAIGIGVGSAAILGLLAYSLQSGAVGAGAGLGEFNWSPDISFAYNNTGMREIRYGTRMDYRHTDWHIWWTASQVNTSGKTKKLRYGSGAQYTADWWSARYNNSVHDKEARADVALKATGEFRDWGGVWKLSPTYRANVEVDEYNVQTWSHRVNLEAVWRINKWTLTQSTGFTAKRASDIGETLQTRLKLTREF